MDPIRGIAVEIPDHVQRGEAARLFPVLSESSKEARAASVLLATLTVVDALADALFRRLGRPIGKRARINCFTEVVLKSDPKFRPDGLVVVDTGRDTWSALVECKVGKGRIEAQQVEDYARKARENGINCVLTISNELVTDPSRPPVAIDGRLTKTVSHFHYSWLAIRSEAEIAYTQEIVTDPEKRYILAELIRFLSHPSSGVEGFAQMPACWPDLIAGAAAGHFPKRSDPRLLEVANAWIQEEKELSLILSRLVSRRCASRSARRVRREGFDPVGQILDELCETQCLIADFNVPDAAADIELRSDLRSKTTRIGMTLRAPEDRKRPEARLNWLLNQLKSADAADIEIVAHWSGRARSTMSLLGVLRDDPKQLLDQAPGASPYAFEIVKRCHTPSSFAGRRRFVADLETEVQEFYSNIGRLLTAWQPRAPAPTARTAVEQIEEDSTIDPERLTSVEQSLSAVLQSLSGPSPQTSPNADDGDPSEQDQPASAQSEYPESPSPK